MTRELDQKKTEAFGARMLDIYNGASLALMISIGHQTGLFDTMAGLPPSTSQQIAEATGLNERYVREWLRAIATGHIVDYEPDGERYALPPEHAASLTLEAGTNNLAPMAQFFPLMGNVEEGIIECFRKGGGVPYSSFPRFQQLMAEESGQVHDAALLETILPIVPGLVQRLQSGIDVADVGCGQGHAINLMAKAFPNSRFTGYDFSEEGIAAGRAEAGLMGLSNARFEIKDVAMLEAEGQFDFITAFDAIHDQAQPTKVLNRIATALRPGGTFLMVDIAASSDVGENLDHPMGPFMYTISCLHCMTVSLALDGEGLGTMWGEQKAREMLADAGFAQIEVKQVPDDTQNSYYIARKR
ncbi:MAG: class I SAM-dependent methyltransferase [Dehalococcoidia bacterium]